MNTPAASSSAHAPVLELINRVRDWLERVPYTFLAIPLRLAVATVFWNSAMTKLTNCDTAVALFVDRALFDRILHLKREHRRRRSPCVWGARIRTRRCVKNLIGSRIASPILAERKGTNSAAGQLRGISRHPSRIFSTITEENIPQPLASLNVICINTILRAPQIDDRSRIELEIELTICHAYRRSPRLGRDVNREGKQQTRCSQHAK